MNRVPSSALEFFPEFCELPPPAPALRASVVIPARDEAAHVVCALDALRDQRDLNGIRFDPALYEVLLLANNCRDATAQVARKWGAAHPEFALHIIEARFAGPNACVGYARRMAMNAACYRLSRSRSDEPRAICSTDADTRVSAFWLAHLLEEFRLGADAVGGRILLNRHAGDAATRATYLLDTAYRLFAARLEAKIDPQSGDPWPRHFQFFGASLAVAPDVYARIGGLPRARCLEDVALENELLRRDLTVRHSPNALALTSARRDGRVETGLSTQLDEWARRENVWLVPSGEEIAWRARLKRRLRTQFFARSRTPLETDELARALLLPPKVLALLLHRSEFFGELWAQTWELAWSNPALRARWPAIPVARALQQLRAMLRGVVPK